ncbi:hypothetical protein AAGG74_19045 [Bacillus mexicanus]|uniref:hypothetical protein n=1 Tax=Bacillus mexicanus TaxID=2834415 RepID=UPI003D263EA9
MFKICIKYHRDFYDHLISKNIPNTDGIFIFLHKEHFAEITSSFFTDYIIETELDNLIKNKLLSNNQKDDFFSLIDIQLKKEIQYYCVNLLYHTLNDHIEFSIDRFISFSASDIQKYIKNTFYEHLSYSKKNAKEISFGKEKTDIVYMVVEPNGSITLEKKDCTVIGNYSYYQQEQAVAEVLFLNPFQLIVYDSLHLLQPEMTICLKKYLKGKVVFIEQEHPLRENRTQ